MGATSRKRKFFVLCGLVAAIVIVALASAPLWFPWVLPSILKHYGITYSSYERDGYTRFVLRNVQATGKKSVFKAARVDVLFPTTFLVRNFRDDHSENYLRVSDWTLEFSETAKGISGTNSVYRAAKKLDRTLEQLDRWIPKASLSNGTIRLAGERFSISAAEWLDGNLSGRISSEKFLPETFFHAHLGRATQRGILIENPSLDLGADFTVTKWGEGAFEIHGGALWLSNRIDLAARFGRKGWLPQTAFVKSESFRIPAKTIRLEGYRDLAGALDLEWKTNQFTLDLNARAEPRRGKEIFLSPLTAIVHASGDTNSVRVETLSVSSPWLSANLSKNAEFSFRGEMLSPTAALQIAADLSGQKWINASGRLRGEAFLRRGKNRYPDTTFEMSGDALSIESIEMNRLDLQGRFSWPWLSIESARVQFKETANAEASLRFNVVTREITDGKARLNGSIGHKFLPPEISYHHIDLSGEFSGSLTNLSHSGHVKLQDAKFPEMAPLEIAADWRGTQINFTSVQGSVSAKESSLVFGGAAKFDTNKIDARIDRLVLNKNNAAILNLEKPFGFSSEKSAGKSGWSLSMEPLRWRGNKTEVFASGRIDWPQQGNVSVSAQELAFVRFKDFFERPLPEAFIDKLNASASWTNGPATFAVNGLARIFFKDGALFSAELRAGGNEKGISIARMNVGTATEAILSGEGFLPLTLAPGNRSNLVQILPEQKIDFHARTIPDTQFWEHLESWMGTRLVSPRASLSISGTLDSPKGTLTASAKEILLQPKTPGEPVPRLKNFLADFDLDRQRVTLNRAEVFVEGQPVIASGEFPLPKKFPRNWRKIFDWRKASASVRIVDAQIAPFERLFPKILSPLGTVNLDLAITNGNLDGELRVADAGLRPIPSLGPVHDITANVKFLGQLVTLENFEGNLGGQPVRVSGEINLAKRETNGFPDFTFNVRGTNVPLSRSPDLILRSDIDLTIVNTNAGEPLVSGGLNLRDSFLLSDLKLLIPGKVAKPKQRPPYFSVEAEPFARWGLDVAVSGTNFLKVRSPLFRGELSANLKLNGTLKEPVALGDVKINSGIVQFPFANLGVDSGFVSLTSENPYRPQLSIAASARTYGYDVKMNVNGFADQPVIEFSSNPGLTSEQILLMLTAGELPRDELTFSTQQKAGRLAFFLGKNLISKFGATGAQDDKLQIRSGENISEQGRQTYYIEYKLTDDWSIIGEYDRFGGLNAGFKWKFFEK